MRQKDDIQRLLAQKSQLMTNLSNKLARVMLLRKEMDNEDPPPIIPNLYVGSYSAATNTKFLSDNNITHIISCVGHIACTDKPGLKYLRLSFKDNGSEDILKYMEEVFGFIELAVGKGEGVLVHCFKGVSRSPTLVAGYLIKKMNLSANEALKMIKEKYPHSNPNAGFVRQLQECSQSTGQKVMTKYDPQNNTQEQPSDHALAENYATTPTKQHESQNLLELTETQHDSPQVVTQLEDLLDLTTEPPVEDNASVQNGGEEDQSKNSIQNGGEEDQSKEESVTNTNTHLQLEVDRREPPTQSQQISQQEHITEQQPPVFKPLKEQEPPASVETHFDQSHAETKKQEVESSPENITVPEIQKQEEAEDKEDAAIEEQETKNEGNKKRKKNKKKKHR